MTLGQRPSTSVDCFYLRKRMIERRRPSPKLLVLALFVGTAATAASFVPVLKQKPHHNGLLVRTRRRQEVRELFNHEESSSVGDHGIVIRRSRYVDLGVVSDIIMESFYTGQDLKAPWRHLSRMMELSRLQQNFPYNDELHYMLVAEVCSNDDGDEHNQKKAIVGFCDVDARPKPPQDCYPPRPYLSDLAVHTKWRRRGIAKALVFTCEDLVLRRIQKSELFIRVEQANQVAIQMYQQLQYQHQPHPVFGVKDTTMLLRKELERENDGIDESMRTRNGNLIVNGTVPILNNVV